MTTDQEAEGQQALHLPVPLLGREIECRMPSPEQLLVWRRTVHRLTEAPIDASWTGTEVMDSLERLRKIIDSLLVNRSDVDWLDDQFLEQKVTFQDLAPFITRVTDAYAQAAQQESQSAAAAKKPAKKAARKKATTPR